MKVTVLGCGGSMGVPTASGFWGDCDRSEIRNYRRRPGVLVETCTRDGEPRTILIDTPPELREQLVRAGTTRIDAVLFTHSHADHVHGIDDVRPFAYAARAAIPFYAERHCHAALQQRFGYAVDPLVAGHYRTILVPNLIDGPFEAAGVPVVPFAQDHGFGPSTGFRIGNFGYSIDVMRLEDDAFEALAGITHWIVDCQQEEPHPTHSHLAQTLAWIRRVGPAQAVLTHLGHKLDYRVLSAKLPDGVAVGFDGLSFELDDYFP